jgi:dihydroorotate dehydrogenase (fumarate)
MTVKIQGGRQTTGESTELSGGQSERERSVQVQLATKYLGLELPAPVIVSSSGLTQTVDGVRRCAAAGAGAVVLKSIFEEQITSEVDGLVDQSESPGWHPEAEEYLTRYGREDAVSGYLALIREAKRAVDIPVIASVHCVTAGAWTDFAERMEQAGADALELNVFVLPSDPRRDAKANEKVYFDIARAVKRKISIPVALKIGRYFSGLSQFVTKLSYSGVDGLVLFNRFVKLDFDIEEQRIVPASIFSHPEELALPLRWISILSGQVGCNLAAATGVHDGAAVVKQLLAGASAVQVCSALYQREIEYVGTMLDDVRVWMERHGYTSVDEFRGRMSQSQSLNPAAYERVQFMMATAGIE